MRTKFGVGFAVAACASCVAAQGVLVFTKATDYYHESIPTAIQAIEQMGQDLNFPVIANNDSSVFNDEFLSNISVVAFVSNSEPLQGPPILDSDQQAAFLRYLGTGKGFIGVHAASACLFSVPWYSTLVGAWFDYHPDLQQASFLVLNRSNPSTYFLPYPWTFVEEVYYFLSNPQLNNITLMMTVNESSFVDPNNASYQAMYNEGTPHPIGWWRESSHPGLDLNGTFATGRTWYSSLGHTIETWQNETFLAHIRGGLTWVLEASPGSNYTNSSSATPSASARAVGAVSSSLPTAAPTKSSAWTLSQGHFIGLLLSVVLVVHWTCIV